MLPDILVHRVGVGGVGVGDIDVGDVRVRSGVGVGIRMSTVHMGYIAVGCITMTINMYNIAMCIGMRVAMSGVAVWGVSVTHVAMRDIGMGVTMGRVPMRIGVRVAMHHVLMHCI